VRRKKVQVRDIHVGPRASGPGTAAASIKDRRGDERVLTVFRLAKLLGTREEFCLIRNVSSGGLKLEVFSPKVVGEALSIEFGDNLPHVATVRWVDGDFIGVAFDEPIDVAETLAKVSPPGRRKSRPLRLLIELEAVLVIQGSRHQCRVSDISQGGAKIVTASRLNVAEQGILEVEWLGKIPATIQWTRGDSAGIAFGDPVPYRTLASWVSGHSRQQ
jgi:hypothetical protein